VGPGLRRLIAADRPARNESKVCKQTLLRKTRRCLVFLHDHARLLLGMVLFAVVTWLISGTSCIWRATLGLPCPGCGLTRSVLALLAGDWLRSWQMHPLTIPLALAMLYYLLKLVNPRFHMAAKSEKRAMISLIIAFLAVYAVRMVLLFPDQAPMVWNPDSVIGRLLHLIF
jgi:hypothetical protein